MKEKLYVISSIDSENNPVLLSKKLKIVPIYEQPFYKTHENARKSLVSMNNILLRGQIFEPLERIKIIQENILNEISLGLKEENEAKIYFAKKSIKNYYDKLSFRDNGLSIIEVDIQINFE